MSDESLGTSFANWLYRIDYGIANNVANRDDAVAVRRFAISATLLASHAQQAYIAFHNGTTIAAERESLVLSIICPLSES